MTQRIIILINGFKELNGLQNINLSELFVKKVKYFKVS